MKLFIVFVSVLVALALANPVSFPVSNIISRNDSTMSIIDNPIYFHFDPVINSATCADVVPTNIFVHSIYTSSAAERCRDFVDLMGGYDAKTAVDIVFICQGSELDGSGDDDSRLKMFLFDTNVNIAPGKSIGTKWIAMLLQATSLPKNTVISVQTGAEIYLDDGGVFDLKQMAC